MHRAHRELTVRAARQRQAVRFLLVRYVWLKQYRMYSSTLLWV